MNEVAIQLGTKDLRFYIWYMAILATECDAFDVISYFDIGYFQARPFSNETHYELVDPWEGAKLRIPDDLDEHELLFSKSDWW